MRRTTTTLIFVLSLLLAVSVGAQTVTPVGGVVTVYSGYGGENSPRVATLPNGDFVVVWDSYGESAYGVKVPGGSLSNITDCCEYGEPDISSSNAGNFVVVWEGGDSEAVYGQLFNSSGATVGGNFSVGYGTYGYDPHVSMNKSNGNFVVAWQQYGYIYAQTFLSNGNTASTPFTVGSYGSSYAWDPDVAMDSAGNFLITWNSYGTPYGQAFNFSGSPLGSQFSISGYGNGQAVSSTGIGQFVVTWTEGYGYFYGNLVAGKRTPSPAIGDKPVYFAPTTTTAAGGKTQVNVNFGGCGWDPDVDANGSYFVVTWAGISGPCGKGNLVTAGAAAAVNMGWNALKDLVNPPDETPNIDGSGSGIGAQVYTNGGTPVGGNFIANFGATASYQYNPSVSINASDRFTVAWQGSIANQQFQIGQPPPPVVCPPVVVVDLVAPEDGAEFMVGEFVKFEWTPAPGATGYQVWASVNGGVAKFIGASAAPSVTRAIEEGTTEWYVITSFGPTCKTTTSAKRTVKAGEPTVPPPGCGLSGTTLASVVGEATTGESYSLIWDAIEGASKYYVQESTTAEFITVISSVTTAELKTSFKHPGITAPTPFFYRVAGIPECNESLHGPYSKIVRVVGLPKPEPSSTNPQIVTEYGNSEFVESFLFIPGFGTSKTSLAATYLATSNEEWLTVSPSSGPLPPEGLTVSLIIDPTVIGLGANTATVTVTRDDGLGKSTSGSSSYPVPAAISLVTPVTPIGKAPGPPANALIIPAVANVPGFESKWFSDVRITNRASQLINYELNFSSTDPDGVVDGKRTKISIRPGQTVALDDIVRQWYGFGDLADGTNGALEIRPLNFQGKVGGTEAAPMLATVASSRTYTRNENSLASYGQFIPAVPFSSFIKSGVSNSLLMMQQVSQNADLRTNFGLVEGAGKSVNVLMTAYDREGNKLGEFPFLLKGGEHKQLNSLLALNNIAVKDGRMEVSIVSGDGAVTSYASVVARGTGDPSLVPGINPALIAAKKFVLAGMADLRAGDQSWRSDVRIYNPNPTVQMVNVFFYPQGETTPLGPVELSIAPGEIAVLEGVVDNLFGRQDLGGALHVVPASGQDTSLIVTGETYDVSELGKYGQFISAVTEEQAIGLGSPGLEVMQVEDSAQFRTNLGIAEVTGKSATVQVQLTVPNSLIAPTRFVALEGNEFTQLNGVVREMAGGRDVYNGRLTVKVTVGEGKITTYGSTVDIQTKDATFSPGQ